MEAIDRNLILKILGKKDSVDLGDMVFNLRGICNDLRDMINLNSNISNDFLSEIIEKLNNIYEIIKPISEKLKSPDVISGYTNSKIYLLNFTNRLCTNIIGLSEALNDFNISKITYHNNIIIDLVLKY